MTPDTEMDGLIDDEGNLLGVVNVVDALVLLLVLVVAVAGTGLVLGVGDNSNQETDTTFITLDLGTQPDYIVAALNEGDTYSPAGESSLTVTDLYLTPQGEQTRVVVQAELQGLSSKESIEYDGAPPRLGRVLDISTDAYNVAGRISDIGGESSLDTNTTTVVLQSTVSAADANTVAPGDQITVAGRTAATIEDVAVYPTSNLDKKVLRVEANVNSYASQGTRRFGATALRPGQSVQLPTAEYIFTGRIERIGSGLDTSTTTVLLQSTVSAADANTVAPGDQITVAGRTAATIEDVAVYPTSNLDKKVLRVEANVNSYASQGTRRFGATALRPGQSVQLPTAESTFTGRIERLGSGLDTSTTTVLLRDTVSATDASEISSGDKISVDGDIAATIEDVAVYPTTNPERRRVLVEANVSSYRQQDTRRFGTTTLRTGQELTLPTDEYTINGRIEQVDTSLQSRELINRTVTLELTKVPEETANAIRPGQTEQAGTVPTAYVTGVTNEPSPIIATAQDGSVVVNDHPTLRRVTLTTELRVSETVSGIEFRGQRIQYGSTVVLDLGPVTVQTTVVNIDQ